MSKAIYVGIDNTARRVPKLYIGVDGIARKVKKGYVGVDGVARVSYAPSTQPSRLPSGYTELEYIYTDSAGQYIDTGVVPDKDTKLIIEAQCLSIPNSPSTIVFSGYTCNVSGYYHRAAFEARIYDSTDFNVMICIGFTGDNERYKLKTLQVAHNMTGRFRLVMNGDGTSEMNGISFPAENYGGLDNNAYIIAYTEKLRIFNVYESSMRLYSCKIYKGSELLRDFVPCKSATGLIGVYDLGVTNKLYQSGQGAFLAGPTI